MHLEKQKRLLNTNEIRAALRKFGEEALKCYNIELGEFKIDRLKMHSGVTFILSDDVYEAQVVFTDLAIKKLGSVRGHPKVLVT